MDRPAQFGEGDHVAAEIKAGQFRPRFEVVAECPGQAPLLRAHDGAPGKARFAYDPPSGLLVVSDGDLVSVQDSRLKTFESYPLGATPRDIIAIMQIGRAHV